MKTQNKATFTAGPWRVGVKHPCRVITSTGEVIWCCNPNDEGTEREEEKANAQLIACAPELLEALQECADWLCDATPGSDQWERGQKARAALAKATGEA